LLSPKGRGGQNASWENYIYAAFIGTLLVGLGPARGGRCAVRSFDLLYPGHYANLIGAIGFYALLDGIFDIVSALRAPSHHWPLIVEGIVGIIVGILTFLWPGITAMVLLYLIAFWAIFTGVLEIVAGVRLREVIANEFLLILMGVISVLFGLLILIFPSAGALAILFWIGAYAVVFGIILIILAFRLRSFRQLEA
jgi:uncharacterized membrane protein HdeD (DUF308 family)